MVFALVLFYGLWNEELTLHLECAFLGFCTDRTNRNALCPDVIIRYTLRIGPYGSNEPLRIVLSCNNEMHAPYVLSIRTVSNSDGLGRTYGLLTALNVP